MPSAPRADAEGAPPSASREPSPLAPEVPTLAKALNQPTLDVSFKLVLQAASKAQRAAKLILGVPEEGQAIPVPAPARVLEFAHEDEVSRQYREAELSWLAAA